MARESKVQMTGSEADLSKGPRDMRADAFLGGTVEMIGSESDLSRRTTPMQEFNKGVRGGKTEMIGSEADLSYKPQRGWNSYSTPISENTLESEQVASSYPRPTGRKRR